MWPVTLSLAALTLGARRNRSHSNQIRHPDEFQRFTDLLRNETPPANLRGELFNYTDARVLLLSATPYKPFDLDIGVDGGESGPESHRDQFHDTLGFSVVRKRRTAENPRVKAIAGLLHEFRVAVTSGDDPSDLRDRLRAELLTLMCRTGVGEEAASMVSERPVPAGTVSAADVEQFIKLTELAKLVTARCRWMWKSVPELGISWMPIRWAETRTNSEKSLTSKG